MSYLNLDFKSGHNPRRTKRRTSAAFPFQFIAKGILFAALGVAGIYVTLNLLPDSVAEIEDSTLKQERLHYPVLLPGNISSSIDIETPLAQDIEATAIDEPDLPATNSAWETVKVKSGDTLASIFSKAGFSPKTTHEVVSLNEQTSKLTRILPGQAMSFLKDNNDQLTQLKFMPNQTQTLVVKRQQDNALSSEMFHHPLDPIPVYKSGVIESSLFLAAEKHGIPENIIMEMAGIFGWDIDFALDIRKGDTFGIVYNELYKDGVKIRTGRILSAEFNNQGKQFKAVYYTDPKGDSGYYTPEGKSMRKAFLRSPVKFSRISSKFSLKRWHPVLSKWRSHKGVDYAASRGTPVRAAGDGKVSFVGTKGGYGKVIFLQHGGKYRTVYGHLSRFASGVRNGKRIKQGQVIGYVGSTGLASGPHLHYEFRVNGAHRNPLTVKLPAAEPNNKAYLDHFKKETRTYLSLLELMDTPPLAKVE